MHGKNCLNINGMVVNQVAEELNHIPKQVEMLRYKSTKLY